MCPNFQLVLLLLTLHDSMFLCMFLFDPPIAGCLLNEVGSLVIT